MRLNWIAEDGGALRASRVRGEAGMRIVHWKEMAGVVMVVSALSGCQRAPEPTAAAPTTGPDANAVGTIKDLMVGIVDPTSDVLFESVAITITDSVEQRQPRTDEEWAAVQHAALALSEVSNLLRMRRLVAAEGETVEETVNEAPELTPSQIHARIDENRDLWNQHLDELQKVSVKALQITKAR
ncbi:MAG: hypothetical protein AB7I50_04710, partial [Vicinamibacterales bacterium]